MVARSTWKAPPWGLRLPGDLTADDALQVVERVHLHNNICLLMILRNMHSRQLSTLRWRHSICAIHSWTGLLCMRFKARPAQSP